jgi:hypothetical protein
VQKGRLLDFWIMESPILLLVAPAIARLAHSNLESLMIQEISTIHILPTHTGSPSEHTYNSIYSD